MQSLVPSLSLNNLIPFTIFFSFVYLCLDKIVPLRIGKNRTPPDWQKQHHSGLAKLGSFRIGNIGTLPDWQKQDPSGLAKIRPLQIGKNKTPPNWVPSGFVKLAFQRLSKFSPDTLPEKFSDAIILLELPRKGVFSLPRPFRIEAKSLI